MKFLLMPLLLLISFALYGMDHSGQTDGAGYSTSNVQRIDSSIAISFANKANLACKTRDKDEFFNLFSDKVKFDIFRDKVDRHKRYGITSYKGEKLEGYISLICKEFINSSGSVVNFFTNPSIYEYGIIDLKKKPDSSIDEPVWYTRLCVYKDNLCTLSIRAVIENGSLRIDEH